MKNLFKNEQSGRSMVEMLGVLAIIGVLSVGGISGYSKAMAKYKLTKAQDQMAMILINIRTAFASAPSYNGLTNKNAVLMNIIPGDMLPSGIGVGSTVKNAFGGNVTLAATNNNTQFTIKFDGLGKEACASLGSSDWGSDGLVSVKISDAAVRHTVLMFCRFRRQRLLPNAVKPVPLIQSLGHITSQIWSEVKNEKLI